MSKQPNQEFKLDMNDKEIVRIRLNYSMISGAYAGFLRGGGPNFKISGILDIHGAKRHVASSELLLGGFGGMPPQENF